MEARAQTIRDKEHTEFQAGLRKLKEEERNEEAQAEALVSKGEYLKGEYTQERESLVKQLEIRLMAERERVHATASNQTKS